MTAIIQVDTIVGTDSATALKAYPMSGLVTGNQAIAAGYYTKGDGGGGIFYFVEGVGGAADEGIIFAPNSTGSSNRWYRVEQKTLNLRQWGAKGDYTPSNWNSGTSTEYQRVQAALDWWSTNAGVCLEIGPGNYRIDEPLRVIFTSYKENLGPIIGTGGVLCAHKGKTSGVGTVQITPAGAGGHYGTLTGSGTHFNDPTGYPYQKLEPGDQLRLSGGTMCTILFVVSDTVAQIYEHDVTVSSGATFDIWRPTLQFLAGKTGSGGAVTARRLELHGLRMRGYKGDTVPDPDIPAITGGALLSIMAVKKTYDEDVQDVPLSTIDGFLIEAPVFEEVYNVGIETGKGVFEGQLNNAEISNVEAVADYPTASTPNLVQILDQWDTGNSSSIFINEPNLRGGKNALFSTVSDINLKGGTFLNAWKEGVWLKHCKGRVDGGHYENCWLSTTSKTQGQAGLRVDAATSGVVISGVKGNNHTDKAMVNVVRVSAPSGKNITVIGGQFTKGNTADVYCYADNDAGGTTTILGQEPAEITAIPDISSVELTYVGRLRPTILAARHQYLNLDAGHGANAAVVNLKLGGYLDLDNYYGDIRVNNPTNWTPEIGDEITFEFRPRTGGPHQVTWGTSGQTSLYNTVSALETTPTKATFIRFIYGSTTRWCEVFRSTP